MWKHSLPFLCNTLCVVLLVVSFQRSSCEFRCPANYTYTSHRYFPHPIPNKFYMCYAANAKAFEHTCNPPSKIFNVKLGHCDEAPTPNPTNDTTTTASSVTSNSITHFNSSISEANETEPSKAIVWSSRPSSYQECKSKIFREMVHCFQKQTMVSKEKLKANSSTHYGQNILKRTLKDADEIFEILQTTSKTGTFNGFAIVSSLDAIGREVISRAPSSNESYGMILFSETIAAQVSLFRQGFLFPNSSLKEFKGNIFTSTSISFSVEYQPTVVNGISRRIFCVLYFQLHNNVPTRVLDSEKNYSINSHLISCQLSPSPQANRGNVYITSRHIKSLDREAYSVCAFWNFTAPSVDRLGAWSRRGCRLMTERSNATHSVCSCNHLTNFAILLGKERYHAEKVHKFALSVITYAGSALSLFGSVAAVGSFVFLSGLHSDRNIIHVNLLTSIAISQTVFLAGVEQTESKAQCKFTAIMLHYFYLVSFAWMLCEGLHLYAMIIKVFNLTSRIYHFVALGWGGPAVLVIITASVRFDSYGTSSSCWLSSERHALLAFIIPVGFTVVVNFIIMAMVLKEVLKLQTTSGRPHMVKIVKTALKSLAILFPLLGITWVFGLLLFATKQIFFQYLFAIFSSMQGFFIFLLHCVFNSEIRKSFRRKKETWKSLRAIRSMKKRLSCSVTPSSGAVTPGTKEQTAISSERAVTVQRSNNTTS